MRRIAVTLVLISLTLVLVGGCIGQTGGVPSATPSTLSLNQQPPGTLSPALINRPSMPTPTALRVPSTQVAAGTAPATQWAQLRRPLDLPALTADGACPVTTHPAQALPTFSGGRVTFPGTVLVKGPVFVAPATWKAGTITFASEVLNWGTRGIWYWEKIPWVIDPSYAGPVLVRGHQVDGSTSLIFGPGEHDDEIQIVPQAGSDWRFVPAGTLVPAPGCYAYQVDGVNFTYHIIFQATYVP